MKRSSRAEQLGYLLFAGVLFILFFFLYRYTVFTLDSDAASELVLAEQLAEEGRLISKNWLYGSELRVFYSQLIFAPLMALLGDWSLVRMIGTGLMLLALVISFYFFCRELGFKGLFPWAAMIMLLPLSRIYFDVLYKFSYYLPHVIIGFLVPFMVLRYECSTNADRGCIRFLPLAAAMLLSFAVGLNGMRLLLCLYIPLVLSVCFLMWQEKGQLKPLLEGSGLCALAAVLGCAVNILLLSKSYSVLDIASISFAPLSFERIETAISGLLDVFGYRSNAPLFSKALIFCAQGGLLFLLSIGASVLILKRRDLFSWQQRFVPALYLSSFLVLLLLFAFTDMQYTDRYMIQCGVLGILPMLICLGERRLWGKAGSLLSMLLCAFLLFSSALHYNDMRKEDKTRAQRECAEYLVSNGYEQGYASFWNGNVMTELSDGALDIWVWDEHFAELSDPDDIVGFLQSKHHLQPPGEGKVFVLLSANEDYYCPFAKNFDQSKLVFKTSGYSPEAIHEYVIYSFDSYEQLRENFGL